MAHLIQVGTGSGGMPVLDMVSRDPRIEEITIIEPDVYKPHNVYRHMFPHSAVGQKKGVLAKQWLLERRPDLKVNLLLCDLLDPQYQEAINAAIAKADVGSCAADNEAAKYHWDALMRYHKKPWTLGEVLSGGIGGFVHWFTPGGPCYGCVASRLQRTIKVDNSPPPDYNDPGGAIPETTIPAGISSIHTIASIQARLTEELLSDPTGKSADFTSLLVSLKKTPGVFKEAFKHQYIQTPRNPNCLICAEKPTEDNVDEKLAEAIARLGYDEPDELEDAEPEKEQQAEEQAPPKEEQPEEKRLSTVKSLRRFYKSAEQDKATRDAAILKEYYDEHQPLKGIASNHNVDISTVMNVIGKYGRPNRNNYDNEERDHQLVRDYLYGREMGFLTQKYRLSYPHIRKILVREGVWCPSNTGGALPQDHRERNTRIAQDYQNDMPLAEMEAKWGLRQFTITRILGEMGIQKTRKGSVDPEIAKRNTAIVQEYLALPKGRNKEATENIAAKYGITVGNLYAILVKYRKRNSSQTA